MEIPSYFTDFISDITPSTSDKIEYQKRHSVLRARLVEDEVLGPLIVSTFLQGSYRRSTLVRPPPDKNADVDVVVVTRIHKDEYTPEQAMNLFVPFLEKYYHDKYEFHDRSICISMANVDLDLVITSAPSTSQMGILQSDLVSGITDIVDGQTLDWKSEPLYIPDRERKTWEQTDPLEQIEWTHEKNRRTNGLYVNVVKAIKWWRRNNQELPKYPKGYPLEHLIGLCCPDNISSIAEGVTLTLERIAKEYRNDASTLTSPYIPDHGVPQHNVLRRVSGEDFAAFHEALCESAVLAREAFDAETVGKSAAKWGKLFIKDFPKGPSNEDDNDGPGDPDNPKGGFSPRDEESVIGGGRFA